MKCESQLHTKMPPFVLFSVFILLTACAGGGGTQKVESQPQAEQQVQAGKQPEAVDLLNLDVIVGRFGLENLSLRRLDRLGDPPPGQRPEQERHPQPGHPHDDPLRLERQRGRGGQWRQ